LYRFRQINRGASQVPPIEKVFFGFDTCQLLVIVAEYLRYIFGKLPP
jgi:hypothetical protein